MDVVVEDEVAVAETDGEVEAKAEVSTAQAASATSVLQQARRRSSVTKPPSNPSRKKDKKKHNVDALVAAAAAAPPPTTAPPRSMLAASRPVPLLVCSIGNPGSTYANTLHSAGHTVLNKLAAQLGYQQFSKEKSLGNGLVSRPTISGGNGDWTLWQSTSYMNESGKGVRAAYQTWSKSLPDGEGKLVIVHDELEKPLGAVSLKTAQGLSAKGHNGLKSILAHIGNTPFARIGVGIGRPVSRESGDVARYVLKKMDLTERGMIEASVENVVVKLRQLEQG